MNGHVFDYTGECTPEKYIRTMKELLAHVSFTFKEYTTDLKEGLENLADPTAPDNPPEGNQVAFEIWKMDIKGQDSTVLSWDNAPTHCKSD